MFFYLRVCVQDGIADAVKIKQMEEQTTNIYFWKRRATNMHGDLSWSHDMATTNIDRSIYSSSFVFALWQIFCMQGLIGPFFFVVALPFPPFKQKPPNVYWPVVVCRAIDVLQLLSSSFVYTHGRVYFVNQLVRAKNSRVNSAVVLTAWWYLVHTLPFRGQSFILQVTLF